MIRCYLVADEVVGFARQSAEELLTEPGAAARVMGLPSAEDDASRPTRRSSRRCARSSRHEWVPGMCELLDLAVADLPVLWDADFLLGPADAAGEDTYVLCEINCSCVTPFPPDAPARLGPCGPRAPRPQTHPDLPAVTARPTARGRRSGERTSFRSASQRGRGSASRCRPSAARPARSR